MLTRKEGIEEKIVTTVIEGHGSPIVGTLITEKHIDKVLENQEKKRHIGLLGTILGENPNTPIHIVGTVAILLTLSGIGVTMVKEDYGEYWKIITPLITSCLGYIFGKSDNKKF